MWVKKKSYDQVLGKLLYRSLKVYELTKRANIDGQRTHIDSNIHQQASGEVGPWWRPGGQANGGTITGELR